MMAAAVNPADPKVDSLLRVPGVPADRKLTVATYRSAMADPWWSEEGE
jgi:hypothetical protein